MAMDAGRTRSLVLAGAMAAMLGVAGCGTTGLAWVHEPESGVDLTSPTEEAAKGPSRESVRVTDPATAPDLAQSSQGPVRRIDCTITLGETTTASGVGGEVADRPNNPAAPVVVNIYVAPTRRSGTARATLSGRVHHWGGGLGARGVDWACPARPPCSPVAIGRPLPAMVRLFLIAWRPAPRGTGTGANDDGR